MKNRLKRVAVVIDTYGSYGRQLVNGIVRYLDRHEGWDIYLEPGTAEHPRGLHSWAGDGILARVRSPAMQAAIDTIDVPTVVLNPAEPPPTRRSPMVMAAIPDRAIDTELAVQHFRERGFRHVAFCCQAGGADHGRLTATQNAAERLGLDCHVDCNDTHRPWAEEHQRLVAWLQALPKPIGIVSANDVRGREILDAAKAASIRVPDDVAVLGSDDDELLCNLCTPRLSSIRVAADEIGYRSALLLTQLMDGGKPPPSPARLPPLGIVARQSTDVLAIDDSIVVHALRLIRDGATKGITVQQLLEELPISRRALERRFQKWVGRNPQEHIRVVQIREAQRLLAHTDVKLSEVARRVGYVTSARLTQAFKAATGTTPSSYRRTASRRSP